MARHNHSTTRFETYCESCSVVRVRDSPATVRCRRRMPHAELTTQYTRRNEVLRSAFARFSLWVCGAARKVKANETRCYWGRFSSLRDKGRANSGRCFLITLEVRCYWPLIRQANPSGKQPGRLESKLLRALWLRAEKAAVNLNSMIKAIIIRGVYEGLILLYIFNISVPIFIYFSTFVLASIFMFSLTGLVNLKHKFEF